MGISIGAIADVVGGLFAGGGAEAGAAAAIPEAVAITPEVAGLGAGAAAAGAGVADAAALGFPAASQFASGLAPAEAAAGLSTGTISPAFAGAAGALPAAADLSGGAGGLAALAPTSAGGVGPLAPVTTAPLAPVGTAAPGGAAAGGGIGSASGIAAPAGVAGTGGDVTAGLQGAGTAATSSSLPGAVGQGAASGAPSLISGTQATAAVPGLSSLGAAPATAPETLGGFISNPTLSGAGDLAGHVGQLAADNPLTALELGAFGLAASRGSSQPKGYNQIGQAALQAQQQSKTLEGYLTSGQLPPGIAQSLNEATNAAMATIRSQYASRGMSGSSAEAEDIANAQTARASQAANIAMQLYNQGVSESQISSQLYGTIMNTALQQDSEFSNALGNLAFAMAGGVRPLTTAGGQAAAA